MTIWHVISPLFASIGLLAAIMVGITIGDRTMHSGSRSERVFLSCIALFAGLCIALAILVRP